jgi:hypothetical protein
MSSDSETEKPIAENTNIFLENDLLIDEFPIIMAQCMSISIINCPKITIIPNLQNLKNLEIFQLTNSNIPICNTYFPDSLRLLDLSYNCIDEFIPQNLPTFIAELNLSFNNLTTIPLCIESLYNLNNGIQFNFKNNNFWFSMYSDIPPSYVKPSIVEEISFAYKLNLISTSKMNYCRSLLFKDNFMEEVNKLDEAMNSRRQIFIPENNVRKVPHHTISEPPREVSPPRENTVYNNAENVHLSSIQINMKNNINYILSYNPVKFIKFNKRKFFKFISKKLNLESINKFSNIYYYDTVHPLYHTTYSFLLYKIYNIICDSEYKDNLLDILRIEILESLDTCTTGQFVRLVNTLNVFIPQIKISISKNEDISNSIIAIRKKHASLYKDATEYTIETIPIVWQFLEEMCVPEIEMAAWLEYV